VLTLRGGMQYENAFVRAGIARRDLRFASQGTPEQAAEVESTHQPNRAVV